MPSKAGDGTTAATGAGGGIGVAGPMLSGVTSICWPAGTLTGRNDLFVGVTMTALSVTETVVSLLGSA